MRAGSRNLHDTTSERALARKPAGARWLRRAALILAAVIAAWGVLGALFLPGFFRSQLEQFVSQNTRGSLSIGRLIVNPFILAAGIRDFTLLGPERDTLLSAKEFTLDASITSIARRGIVLDRIALVGPQVHLTVLPDGTLDWMRLMAPRVDTTKTATAPAELPSLRIRRLTLGGGRLLFADHARATPYSAAVAPINLDLQHFSTQQNERGDHSFTASLVEGGTLRWQGGFSVKPQAATGRIDVDSLSARALWRWLRSELRFEVPSGRLFVSLAYSLSTAGDRTRLRIQGGSLRASDVRIVEPGREGDVIAIPALAAEGATIDFATSQASVARLHAEGARLLASLSPDTVFNLARLFEPRTPPRPAAGTIPEWRVRLARFDVSGVAVSFTDSTQRPAPTLDLTDLAFETRNLDSGRELSGEISAHSRIADTGTLAAVGHASLAPAFVDLSVHARQVPLRPVQAYLDTFIKLDIVRGNADLDGRLRMGGTQDGRLTFSLRADGTVRRLVAADSASGGDFLRLADARVKGVELDFVPDRFRLRSLELARPTATVALGTDASLNLFRIFPALAPPPPGTATRSVPFVIDRIRVRDGTMHFLDHTVKPPYASSIDSIQGVLENLSSDPQAVTHVALTGRANGSAPMKLDAKVRPANKEPYAIFTLGLSGYEMAALTPYVGKYLGRWVDRGQLSLDLDYKIENRKLKGQNDALLDQFNLGQKSNSPDATNLPVGLALALLRDRDGKIKLDLPVQGDLDDPHFGIGRVILQTLVNLVTKLVLSPFALLGKLIPGGGNETLGDIAFAPGADTLSIEQAERVGKLVSALAERPELRLYVTGAADSILDRASLARADLELQIDRQRRAEFFAAGVPEPEQAIEAPLPEGERGRAFAKLYLKTFGKDSLGSTLPDPELSKGDLRRIAKRAVSGQTSGASTWPPRHPLPPDTETRMKARLLGAMVVAREDLQKLADARAMTLKHQLVDVRGLPEARVFLRGAAVGAEPTKDQVVCRLDLAE